MLANICDLSSLLRMLRRRKDETQEELKKIVASFVAHSAKNFRILVEAVNTKLKSFKWARIEDCDIVWVAKELYLSNGITTKGIEECHGSLSYTRYVCNWCIGGVSYFSKRTIFFTGNSIEKLEE